MKRRLIKFARISLTLLILLGGLGVHAQTSKREGAESPWGTADEIGTLNMMSDKSRFEIIKKASSGKVYDLGVDLFVGMPNCCAAWGDPSFQIWMVHGPARGNRELVLHSSEGLSMPSHGGTHIDALSHFGLNGQVWNGIKADEAFSLRGWAKSSVDKYPPIVARGVLIDVALSKGLKHLPASYSITIEDLQKTLKRQQTTILPGDIVLLRTGLMTLWPDKSKYHLTDQPGLSIEAAEWLVDQRKVMLIGADNFGVESFPSKDPANFAPVHTYLLAEKGVSLIEVLWLEELAGDQVYEFLFIASPSKIRGATGSLVRPIAIPTLKNFSVKGE